jgi:hypothetical protein
VSDQDIQAAHEQLVAQIGELVRKEEWLGVVAAYDAAPEQAQGRELRYFRALAAFAAGNLAKTVELAELSFQEFSQAKEPADLLALTYALAGEVGNASYYRKVANSLPARPHLAAARPPALPEFDDVFLNISDRPLFDRGFRALAANRWREAEEAFTQQIAFTSHDRDTMVGLAVSLAGQGAWGAAIGILQSLRHTKPDDPFVAGELGGMLVRYGRFLEGNSLYRTALALNPHSPVLAANALLDLIRDLSVDPGRLRTSFAAWGKTFGATGKRATAKAAARSGALTVVCFLGASGSRRLSMAFAKVLGLIDPRRYRFVGLGFGDLSSPANAVYQAVFDDWANVSDADPVTFEHIVRAQDPDIIIDLAGFEAPQLLSTFAIRMAPVQLAWQNQPFDAGLPGYTGIISERAIEKDDTQSSLPVMLVETGASLVSLPDSAEAIAERPQGMPLVFGIDAALCDMHPDIVELWARILHALPDAQFLVNDKNFSDGDTAKRLLDIFGFHGVAHRIDVVSGIDVNQFFAQVDILLASAPLPAVTQICDALWAGAIPVMLSVANRIGRQAHPILEQFGLAESCIAETGDDYVAKALAWARDDAGRAQLRGRLRALFAAAPAFDAELCAKALTTVLDKAWGAALQEGEA